MVIRRGELWWANLPEPHGSEPGFRRPVLIVQSDPFNASKIGTVVIAALTTNMLRGEAPGNVVLEPRESALQRRCVINVSQIMTIDRTWLSEKVGVLPQQRMTQVDAGLRLVLGLNA